MSNPQPGLIVKQRWSLLGKALGWARTVRAQCAFVVAFGAMGTGCTVLTSETPEQLFNDGRAPNGVYYALPLSVMDMKLSVDESTARFILTVTGPRSIPDPKNRYVLRYRPLPNYTDDVDVAVNDKMFLSSVNSTTKDETPGIIINLFSFFGRLAQGLEAGEAAKGEKVLAIQTVNPTNEKDVRRAVLALNEALLAYTKSKVKDDDTCGETDKRDFASYIERTKCLTFRKFKIRAQEWIDYGNMARWDAGNFRRAPVKFEAMPAVARRVKSHAAAPGRGRVTAADCTSGICYRPLQPYYVVYSVGLSSNVESAGKLDRVSQPGFRHQIVLMPNEAEPVVIDIRRAFFVQKIQNIKFSENGFLQYFAVNKESELLALSKLPVDILSAVAEVFRFRVKVLDQEKNEADAMKGLIEQRRELEKQRLLLDAALNQARMQEQQAASVSDLPPAPPAAPQSGAVQEPGVLVNF